MPDPAQELPDLDDLDFSAPQANQMPSIMAAP